MCFKPPELESTGVQVLNNLIDLCFVVDIIACCRTTFYELETGDEVFQPKLTALKYVRSARFVLDLVSTIPLDTIGFVLTQQKTPALQLFSLLKLARVSRITKIISRLNVDYTSKQMLRLSQLVLLIVIYIHCTGCLWFLLVKQDALWVPPLDSFDLGPSFYEQDQSFLNLYLMSIYYAVILLVGKDIVPVGRQQVLFTVVALMLGSLLNANIFGNIAVIVSEIKLKGSLHQDVIDTSNTAMRGIKMNADLNSRMVTYIKRNLGMADMKEELEILFDLITPSMKQEII